MFTYQNLGIPYRLGKQIECELTLIVLLPCYIRILSKAVSDLLLHMKYTIFMYAKSVDSIM